MKKYALALILLSGMIASACNIRSNEHYYFNANGGGKITLKTTFLHVKLQKDETLDDAAKRIVDSVINKSKGVETWANVSYSTGKENSVNFEGTAYFADFNTLLINNITMYFRFKLQKSKDGFRLVFEPEEKKSSPGDPAKADETVDKKLKDWEKQREAFKATVEISRIERTFHIKAKDVKASNLKMAGKNGNYSLNIIFDGPVIFEALDAFSTNEDAIRKGYLEGTNKYQNAIFMEKLIGNSKPVEANVSGAGDVFDYEKEVAAAKNEYPEMIKKLGLATGEDSGEPVMEEEKEEPAEQKTEPKEESKNDSKNDKKKDKKKKKSDTDKLKNKLK